MYKTTFNYFLASDCVGRKKIRQIYIAKNVEDLVTSIFQTDDEAMELRHAVLAWPVSLFLLSLLLLGVEMLYGLHVLLRGRSQLKDEPFYLAVISLSSVSLLLVALVYKRLDTLDTSTKDLHM